MTDQEKPNDGGELLPSQADEAVSIVPVEQVQTKILTIRGQRVILDADLADLYGVPTKRLNEQVKRNLKRFPPDFMFQWIEREKAEVVANCDHLQNSWQGLNAWRRPSGLTTGKSQPSWMRSVV